MTRQLALLLCLAATFPSVTAAAPSFDCKKAQTPVEKAICSDDEAAEADRAVGLAFQSLTARAGTALVAALRQDQRDFIAIRDEAFGLGHLDQDQRVPALADRLEMRINMLNWINPEPPVGYEGNWRNTHGLLTITRDDKGQLSLQGETVDQVLGSWVCHLEGPLTEGPEGSLEVATDEGPARLVRKEGFIELTDARPNRTQEYCGLNGGMAGPFFYIGAEDDRQD
ncbi:lysozyme inhibitor LprI family protein [Paracoccus aminophilus]|nr:lysozyme inhibitor LprI family protein [Paracoccus aminophilus]